MVEQVLAGVDKLGGAAESFASEAHGLERLVKLSNRLLFFNSKLIKLKQ